MAKTIFSNERKQFDTTIEGNNVRLTGQATLGKDRNCYGQAARKDNGNYVGDYSEGNISIADPADYTLMPEISALWVQLRADIAAKEEEQQEEEGA